MTQRDYPFFYAKVDIEALTRISSNGKLKWKPIDPPYETYMSLPIPKQQFHVSIPISDPHLITDTCLYKMNLNPNSIFCYGTILSIGTLCEFEEKDGYWCMMTHCRKCYREFLGFPRVQTQNMETIRCDTPNCANNLLFRQQLKQGHCYLGKEKENNSL